METFLRTNKSSLKVSFLRSLEYFKFFFLTFISLIILMATIKNISAVKRPFFFDICKPDSAVNCTAGTFLSADFRCTNTEVTDFLLSESQRSFPSGHVVYVVYACGIFMWYLHARIAKFPIILTFVYVIILLWMAICCVTRVTDHWHNVEDVLGAVVITLPFVFYSVS